MAALALLGAACGGSAGGGAGAGSASGAVPTPVAQVPGGPREPTVSALRDPASGALPPPLIDLEELRAGGPPPDGIPSIDDPRFLTAGDVAFLDDVEPVIALEIDGDARAYPLQIMTWHEIVNDTVGGIPVAVTYCPLCNTAIAFDRRLDERVLSFGTSGMLVNSALVMYDRQTESLWSHFTSQALAGALTGVRLATFPASITSWAEWRRAHPSGRVLSRETGFERDYGRNPYPGYDDVDNPPFLFTGDLDGRLGAKERIVGLGLDTDPVALRLDALRRRGVVAVRVGGEPVTVWHLPGTSSALDAGQVAEGRDVGATGAFVPEVGGRGLSFTRDGDRFVDGQTGSSWDIFGRAVAGELAGARLEPVDHVDTFWFAWAAYQPDSRIEPR